MNPADTLQSLAVGAWAIGPDTLLGATLLLVAAALLGEVVWRTLRWPRLMGYVAVGAVLALAGASADPARPAVRLVVDVALALLLFEAGTRLNLRWLVRNPWLLATSVAESALSAVAVYAAARAFALDTQTAAVLALIAMSVSPAVVQRVVGECGAAGQVTERLMALTALNTLFAVLAIKALSAGLLLSRPDTWQAALPAVTISFAGSFLLGVALGSVIALIARRLDLRNENAVMLLLGFVLLAIVIAKALSLSTLLVPLLAGLWLRNRSDRPWVWPRHFGSAGGVLVLALFVAVSSAWSPLDFPKALGIAAALVAVRWLAKAVAVFALARPSGLAWRQATSLGACLLPMSATAWVLALEFGAAHPEAVAPLMPVLLTSLALVELVSPLVLLYALRFAGELDAPEGTVAARIAASSK
ncbi:MAG: cation:proton antiporter [Gammaproteobacteria bacterium]